MSDMQDRIQEEQGRTDDESLSVSDESILEEKVDQKSPKDLKINRFDFITFINLVRRRKKRILLSALIGGALGVFFAFCIPKVYSSSVTLAPEMQDDEKSGMSALASAAGLNMGQGMDAIGPMLYPDVVSSTSFLVGLVDVQVATADGSLTTTYYDYLKNHTKMTWWGSLMSEFGKLMAKINPPKDFGGKRADDGKIDPARMSIEDYNLIEGMRNNIGCNMDEMTGIVTISVKAQDPNVALMMVDTVKQHLQAFVTEYRTSKARQDAEYYWQLKMQAREEYEEAQRKYAEYTDAHQNTILQAYITQQERLENDMQLAMDNYQQLSVKSQAAEAKIQETTPAFTVLEGATLAHKADSPKKMLMTLGFMIVAVVITIMRLYLKLLFVKDDGQGTDK